MNSCIFNDTDQMLSLILQKINNGYPKLIIHLFELRKTNDEANSQLKYKYLFSNF